MRSAYKIGGRIAGRGASSNFQIGALLNLGGEEPEPEDERFIITVDTTKAGSASDTFILPIASTGAVDCTVDWGDGSTDDYITNGNKTHQYASGGTYQIAISGTFPGTRFVYGFTGADHLKIIGWDNTGTTGLSSNQSQAFWGCSNLVYFPQDNISWWNNTLLIENSANMFAACASLTTLPEGWTLDALINGDNLFAYLNALLAIPNSMTFGSLTNGRSLFSSCNSLASLSNSIIFDKVTDASSMFQDCHSLTSLPDSMTFENVTNGGSMFNRCGLLSYIPNTITFNKVTSGNLMFSDCTSLTSLPSSVNFKSLTDGGNMFANVTLTTDSYSTLLVNMAANNINTDVTFNGGNSKYNSAGATARATLVGRGWTITDGGAE